MDENQGETAPKRNGSFLYSCSIWHTQHMGECFLLKHTNVKPNNTAHKQLIYREKKKTPPKTIMYNMLQIQYGHRDTGTLC